MLPTGGVAGVSVFASKVFGNFALAQQQMYLFLLL